MKRIFASVAMAAFAWPAFANTNVGVSVSVNQPGLYGRVDIGNMPPPPNVLVYPQPMIVTPVAGPVVVERRPIYLHVPPGHAKNWRKHCGRYAACGQPVYFVQEEWYQQHRSGHDDHDHDRGGKHDKHHGKHKDKHKDKHDHRR